MSRAHSSIEHLAKTLYVSKFWRELKLAMFTACFDTGGTDHDQEILMTAGFVSSAGDWIEFDEKWRARLALDGIEYFHMKEFAHSTDQFEGWKSQERRRRDLFSDLLDIISSHAYRKFGCGISIPKWNSLISEQTRDDFKMKAYCTAGMLCAALVDNWAFEEKISTPIEVVFEDGDAGKGVLQKSLSQRKPELIFRPKKDGKEDPKIRAFTPLQAADLLAYELFLGVGRHEENVDKYPPRFGLMHFRSMPVTTKYLEPKDFRMLDELLTSIAAALRRGECP